MYIFYTFMQWVESSLRISLCFSCILNCKIILNTNMHRRYLYICTNCTFVNIYIFPETFVNIKFICMRLKKNLDKGEVHRAFPKFFVDSTYTLYSKTLYYLCLSCRTIILIHRRLYFEFNNKSI
jgi:hypothetical protein